MYLVEGCFCLWRGESVFSEGRSREMPYEVTVEKPASATLSKFLSSVKEWKNSPVNYMVNHKAYPKPYHDYCDARIGPECEYNDDNNNKTKLGNNLGCLYGRIYTKLLHGDKNNEHEKQIKYRVAYTKKCINLLHKPPLQRTPSDFMRRLEELLIQGEPYSNKMYASLLKDTLENTSTVFGGQIKTSAEEINKRHNSQIRTHKNRVNYKAAMNELYIKAIVDSANEIISDINKKKSGSIYFDDVFNGKKKKILTTKKKITEKINDIFTNLLSVSEIYAINNNKYNKGVVNKNQSLTFITIQGIKTSRITQETINKVEAELKTLINDLPQIKHLKEEEAAAAAEKAAAAAKAAAEEAAAKAAPANVSKWKALQKIHIRSLTNSNKELTRKRIKSTNHKLHNILTRLEQIKKLEDEKEKLEKSIKKINKKLQQIEQIKSKKSALELQEVQKIQSEGEHLAEKNKITERIRNIKIEIESLAIPAANLNSTLESVLAAGRAEASAAEAEALAAKTAAKAKAKATEAEGGRRRTRKLRR